MTKRFTYADAGVDRKKRYESKRAIGMFTETYACSHFGSIVRLPFGNVFPVGNDVFLDLTIEGVGTKVLLAQVAGRYDTIGIDAVAMAVNDVIRSGAVPLAVADNIHAQQSDPILVREWLRGIMKGALQADCPVVSGEIGDVADVIKGEVAGKGFDMVVATVGMASASKLITGRGIKPGDIIIGMRSSGLHSNGISLARRILLKNWGGKYDAHAVIPSLSRELIYEMLEPTSIYVKPVLSATENVTVKAAVHITGDAYLKFNNLTSFSSGIGFKFYNFKPQPIFELIQQTARELGFAVSDEEMFQTFNMGWGFAIITSKEDLDDALNAIKTAGAEAELIGEITAKPGTIEVEWENKHVTLT